MLQSQMPACVCPETAWGRTAGHERKRAPCNTEQAGCSKTPNPASSSRNGISVSRGSCACQKGPFSETGVTSLSAVRAGIPADDAAGAMSLPQLGALSKHTSHTWGAAADYDDVTCRNDILFCRTEGKRSIVHNQKCSLLPAGTTSRSVATRRARSAAWERVALALCTRP